MITLNRNQILCQFVRRNATPYATVELNRHLYLFKGTRLHVFLSIVLHSDENGWSRPSVLEIQRDTNFRSTTISNAISALCRMKIDGRRVMLAVSERLKPGVLGKRHFLLFPSQEEIARYELYEFTEEQLTLAGESRLYGRG